RYETSKIINLNFVQKPDKVILATGVDFPDALAGSVYAGLNQYPIVLTDATNSVNAINYLKFLSNNGDIIHMEALGLKGAIDESTINRLTTSIK
ncbi:MAG: cell wall-binding repeat-containing protein, partial [Clostridiaceae bacterium]|nr:cell wall-binding repeat-containing protein [Clostridiaceae bacterium]